MSDDRNFATGAALKCKCGSYAINDDPSGNLCDCCWRDAEIERLRAELDEANERRLETVAMCEMLQAIVDQYQKTADGVTITPGMPVYRPQPYGIGESIPYPIIEHPCWSTAEAAEKARET